MDVPNNVIYLEFNADLKVGDRFTMPDLPDTFEVVEILESGEYGIKVVND